MGDSLARPLGLLTIGQQFADSLEGQPGGFGILIELQMPIRFAPEHEGNIRGGMIRAGQNPLDRFKCPRQIVQILRLNLGDQQQSLVILGKKHQLFVDFGNRFLVLAAFPFGCCN